jgi:hypothetical protein
MIILTTDTTEQTFSFIPRLDEFDFDVFPVQDEQTNEIVYIKVNGDTDVITYNKVELIDEQTNESTILDVTTSYAGDYYHTITMAFNLIEGHYYTIRIYQDSKTETRFLGKVFCTNQNLPYSVNTDVYNSRTTNNDFIIYE